MTVDEREFHVRGLSRFVDDHPLSKDALFAAICVSKVPCGKLLMIDVEPALSIPGVLAAFTAKDIPGDNQIGAIVPDEPLLAQDHVQWIGEPLALVVATTAEQARTGAAAVAQGIEEHEPVFDARQAALLGRLIVPIRRLEKGDVEEALSSSATVVKGSVESAGQEHVYLETQGAVAEFDSGRLRVRSATQSPTGVQRAIAAVLGLAMSDVEVEVPRLGGAFGGKEDQATAYAALAALAAFHLRRPVKLVLSRLEDMRLTGKRHPYSTDYRLGLDKHGRITAFEVTYYQNGGGAADLSPAILERSLYHATASYRVPVTRITGYACRTNLPPFTAFRGFGAPQAFLAFEAALDHAAQATGVPRHELQRRNLLVEGDLLPYGMALSNCRATELFEDALGRFDFESRRKAARIPIALRSRIVRGLAAVPVCFGISFTNKILNQASSLVHVYTDGSVSVSTGAVEMGQGVSRKIARIAARTLGAEEDKVRVEATNTTRSANTSPTAASTGADLNGMATLLAAQAIRDRLDALKQTQADSPATLAQLAAQAYAERQSLSAQAYYATPGLGVDPKTGAQTPFAYHVYGTAIVEVELDALLGTYRVIRAQVVHDMGRSLDPITDRGQVEGALLQGVGWVTCEDLRYASGRLTSDTLTTYKIPDILGAPSLEIVLSERDNDKAVMGSKAVGEPPFIYGLGAFFALLDALRTAGARLPEGEYISPLTPERVLMLLRGSENE
jgi:xanthine dehydrogenase large subunit